MAKNNLVTQQGAPVNNAAEVLDKSGALTHAELDNNFFSIYVAENGTAQASKALIVDELKNIGTLGTVTLTDVIINETATFDAEGAPVHSGTGLTIDWTTGNKQDVTLLAAQSDVTSISFTDPVGPCNLLLKVVQNATTPRTLTGWPAGGGTEVYWQGGTAPTLTATIDAVDIISFYFDGTDYYGSFSLDFQ